MLKSILTGWENPNRTQRALHAIFWHRTSARVFTVCLGVAIAGLLLAAVGFEIVGGLLSYPTLIVGTVALGCELALRVVDSAKWMGKTFRR